MDDKEKNQVVDAGLAETEQYVQDKEVAEVYESDLHGHGARSGGAQMREEIREQHGYDRDTMGGDPDVLAEDAVFVGEEAPGGGNPTPDQDIVDDIGEAMGVTYGASEELHTTEKLEERDRHRWELDPASSEDYAARVDREGEVEIGEE